MCHGSRLCAEDGGHSRTHLGRWQYHVFRHDEQLHEVSTQCLNCSGNFYSQNVPCFFGRVHTGDGWFKFRDVIFHADKHMGSSLPTDFAAIAWDYCAE